MHFAPIPPTAEDLDRLMPLWLPFAEKMSRRAGNAPLNDFIARTYRHQVRIGVVWDEEKKEARALLGWELRKRGDDLIAAVTCASGIDMKQWRDLLPEMEDHFRALGCTISRPEPREGWRPFLEQHGYKVLHLVMEKRL